MTIRISFFIVFLSSIFNNLSQCSDISDNTFGDGEWIAHVYSGNNFNTYEGYYIEPNLSFDSRLRWGLNDSPSDAAGYVGCAVGVNQHSVSHKRTNFPCGTYQIDVQGIVNAAGHDDYALLYIDGVLVWDVGGWGQSHVNVWTGYLGPNSTVDFRHREFGGGSYGALNITQLNSDPSISVIQNYDCVAGESALTAGNGSGFSWAPVTGLSATTGETVIASPMVTTTYTVTGTSDCDGSIQSTTVTVDPATVIPTNFGDGEWNVLCYDGNNFDNLYGYYTEPNLSFDTRQRWGSNSTPSNASGYEGCALGIDQHSLIHRRTNFPCGEYQIDILGIVNGNGHDDYAYLYIDGNLVWSLLGCCQSHTNVWTGFLGSTSTVEFRHREFGGGSYGALNFNLNNNTPSLNISSNFDCNSGSHILNASGGSSYNWSPPLGLNTTSGSIVTASPTVPTVYTVTGSSLCDGSSVSEDITILPSAASIESDFGDDQWNVLCYDGNNFNSLSGYYIEPDLSFDTRQRWNSNGSPSDASNYVGCDIPINQHSVSHKRTNFECGDYQIDVQGIVSTTGHDDYAYLYVDEVLVWSIQGCCQSHTNVWTGFLGPNSKVEFRHREFGGGSYGALNFTQLNNNPSFSITPNFDCTTGETTIVASGGTGVIWTPSTFLNTNSGNTVIASPLAPTAYTASGISVCDGSPVSQTITVQPSYTSIDPNSFGNGEWIAFCYNGNNFNTYNGYYVDGSLSFDSRTLWDQNNTPSSAIGYLGCDIPVDQHSVIYKRQGFPCDNYQIDVRGIINNNGHDDHAFLYVDGALVWSLTGCCQSHTNVWSGTLNSSSKVEFRWREFSGQSYGALQVLPATTNTTTWNGMNSSNWATPGNWSNGVPGISSSVVIPSGLLTYPEISADASCLDLTINNGANLSFNAQADLNIGGGLYNNLGNINGNHLGNLVFNSGCPVSSVINTTGDLILHDITLNNGNGTDFIGDKVYVSGHIYPNQGTTNTNGNIVLISDATKTAGIMEISSTADFIGSIESRRLIDAGSTNWRFLTMPVQNADLEQFDDDFITSGFPGTDWPNWPSASNPWSSFYFYDEDLGTTYQEGFVVPSSTSEIVQPGQGIWIWCGDTISGTQDFAIDAFGEINKGNIDYNVTFDNATGDATQDGWNMIANPYPCAIDWNDPDWDKTNVDDAIYIWNPDNQQFASYVGGVGINSGSNLIGQFQGFYVRTNANNPELIVKESCKSDQTVDFIKNHLPIDLIRLEIVIGNEVAETVIRFSQDATDSVDNHFDAVYFENNSIDVPEIYTQFKGIDYGINALHSTSNTIEIPLVITSNYTGPMTLKATDLSGANGCLILEDTYTGNIVDLMQDSTYSFISFDSTEQARFLLKTSDKIEYTYEDVSCFDENDGSISINADSAQLTSLSDPNFSLNSGAWNNLESDVYIMSATNLCGTQMDTVSISQPQEISINIINKTNPSCGTCCDGSAEILIDGGDGNYTVSLDGTQTSLLIDSLCYGDHYLTVTDGNGCSNNAIFQTTSDSFSNVDEMNKQINIYPTLTTGIINVSEPCSIKILDNLGRTLKIDNYSPQIDLSDYSNGVYYIIINDKENVKVTLKK